MNNFPQTSSANRTSFTFFTNTTLSLLLSSFLALSLFCALATGTMVGAQSSQSSLATPSLKINARLASVEIGFSDLVTLTFNLRYDPSQITLAENKAPRPELKRLRYHSFASTSATITESGTVLTDISYVYKLMPIASGAGRVSPVSVSYLQLSDSSVWTVSSEELLVQIAIPQIVDNSSKLPNWFWVALLFLALGAGVFVLRMRQRAAAEAGDSHATVAQTWLTLLKSQTSKRRSQFYQTLYDALYDLAKNAGLTEARRGESEQLISDIHSAAIPGEVREPMARWLTTSAREKFAPDSGQPGETLREYHEFEHFIISVWLPFRRSLDKSQRKSQAKQESD